MPVPQVPQVQQKAPDAVTPYNEGVTLMKAKKNCCRPGKIRGRIESESEPGGGAQQSRLLPEEAESGDFC